MKPLTDYHRDRTILERISKQQDKFTDEDVFVSDKTREIQFRQTVLSNFEFIAKNQNLPRNLLKNIIEDLVYLYQNGLECNRFPYDGILLETRTFSYKFIKSMFLRNCSIIDIVCQETSEAFRAKIIRGAQEFITDVVASALIGGNILGLQHLQHEISEETLITTTKRFRIYKNIYLHEEVAIKFPIEPTQETENQIIGEYTLLNSLDHTNVIRPIGILYCELGIALVTEYCSNGSLAEHTTGVTPTGSKIEYFRSIANALCYIHMKHITHHSVKLSNVLLTSDNTIKFNDFSQSQVNCGNGLSNKAVDISSFGMTIYELFFGMPLENHTLPEFPATFERNHPQVSQILRNCLAAVASNSNYPTKESYEDIRALSSYYHL